MNDNRITIPIIGAAKPLSTPPVIQEIYRLLEELIAVSKEQRDYLKALADVALAENARKSG